MSRSYHIIFDLDGTLWDASEAVALGWNAALATLSPAAKPLTADAIRSICGLPFNECVKTLFPGVPEDDFARWAKHLDSCERTTFERHTGQLYPGVPETLTLLSQRHRLSLVSNCQSWYRDAFYAAHPNLAALFESSLCYGDTGNPKASNIQALRTDPATPTFYVGDTAGDQQAAESSGCAFLYASYGFGDLTCSPRLKDVRELPSLLDAWQEADVGRVR